MIKDKLIEKQKELIKFYGERLADNAMFLHIHRMAETPENCRIGETLRNEIAELEKQDEESSKGAEEILKEKYANDKWEPNFKGILEAMEQYRAEGLREELIKFARQFYADEETCIHNVNEYLSNKQQP